MYPWAVRSLIFPLHEWAKGHPTTATLRDMEKADRMSSAELDRYRTDKMRDLISYGYAHVPYVRTYMKRAGLTASDFQVVSDIARFPIMSKADMREHRQELRSEIAGGLKPFATGGSTGDPLVFDLAKRRVGARVACRQRVSRWWGVAIGDRELALWGSPIELSNQDRIKRLRDVLLSTRLVSAFEMNEDTMSKYLDVLEHGRFRQIFAYPSAIYLLCRHANKQGRDLRKLGLKVVFVTSEVLFPYQRQLISETLNCPVADGYGGRDSGFIAHECPQGGMHIMADAVIVEILDENGRPAAPGQSGEIVVTDLYSHEAPFIRYATGDNGAFSARLCTCGRALPLLERIDGRANDVIVSADGRVINDQSLVYVLREVDGIEHFRIHQQTVRHFHVQIVRNDRFRLEGEMRIRHGWTKLLRSELTIEFEYVDSIPPSASGKFRHVISDVASNQYLSDGSADTALVHSRDEGP